MEEFTYIDILNTEHEKPIKNFKYKGEDASIAYKKCLSPLAQWIVDNKLPETIAYYFFFN